jgi:hypothetical protein
MPKNPAYSWYIIYRELPHDFLNVPLKPLTKANSSNSISVGSTVFTVAMVHPPPPLPPVAAGAGAGAGVVTGIGGVLTTTP